MADQVRVDDSQVRELAADLRQIPQKAMPTFQAIMKRGANNVKRDMQEHARGHRTFPHFARSISYDRVRDVPGIAYEIGPDKDRLGTGAPLANLLYFGSSNNAPVLDLDVGIRAEAPRLERHLKDAVTGLLGL